MKRVVPMLGVLLVAALLTWPTAGKAEMYVEGYLGFNAAADVGKRLGVATPDNGGFLGSLDFPGNINAAFQGGVKLGYWFVKEGFGGYNYPDWAKYFGLYFDFSYHKIPLPRQTANVLEIWPAAVPFPHSTLEADGNAITFAFMFAGRYGFLPDSEVPFGRLQPYLAVGPAILVSSLKPTVRVWNFTGQMDSPARTSVNAALAVETGVRWMALKNVSLDCSFKYRFAQPRYRFDFLDDNLWHYDVSFNPSYHFFSLQVGAAYHF